MTRSLIHRFGAVAAIAALISLTATPAVASPVGVDPARNCVYAGQNYQPPNGSLVAPTHVCYTTPDTSGKPPLAPVNPAKTAAQLRVVQNWSPLHPDHYVARNTFATRDVTGAPAAPNSAKIAATVNRMPDSFVSDFWKGRLRTGASVGGGVLAHDNIPIYTVDSSNPHQEFATFYSNDGRVTNYPRLAQMTTGSIPFPSWGKPSDGGDKALAIYDVATGIMRGYFAVVKQADGRHHFSASGYWIGNPTTRTAGDYWMNYLTGSSSVLGLSNELTQIGIEEVKRGRIDHAVSVTFPDYRAASAPNAISFPSKQSDGKLAPAQWPDAPAAGQMFTFPATFDVEAHIRANNIDVTTAAIMRAVKKHGGIVSDRNVWSMSFNFEHPYGMGARAGNPDANPWQTDAVAKDRIGKMNINKFPWEHTKWLPVHYAARDRAASPTPTPKPTTPAPTPTTPAVPKYVRTAPYTLAGTHVINGRNWRTTCEPYSQTERCRTDIQATVVEKQGNQFVRTTGWAFNNLTYLPFMTEAAWQGNPLAMHNMNGFASGGRQWRTECHTAQTGRGACRSYTLTTVYTATARPAGGYTFSQANNWVFNNIVMFGSPAMR